MLVIRHGQSEFNVHYNRTGIAYAMEDVEKYILGIAAGKKPSRPKPIKGSRGKS